jgi:hypothetical protein
MLSLRSRRLALLGFFVGAAFACVFWQRIIVNSDTGSLDESTCVEGVNCDMFTLTLSGTPINWSGLKARIVISCADPSGLSDYDLYVHKGDNTGPLVGISAHGGTPPEVVDLDPSDPTIGTGQFSVHVVYFSAFARFQYSGSASPVSASAGTTLAPSVPLDRFTARLHSAMPSAGTLNAVGPAVNWVGTAVGGGGDLPVHIQYARRITSLSDIRSPHFLFELLIKALSSLTGASLVTATAILLGGCYGLMAVLIAHEIKRRGSAVSDVTAAALSVAILVASHIFLPTIFKPNLYYNYLVPTAYHNPTQQLNKLFTIAIWFLYCRRFLTSDERPLSSLVLLAVLVVASAIAKPSFLIAFLPVSGLLAAWDLFHGRWSRFRDYVAAIALPAIAAMGWQFWMTYGIGAESRIEFAPLAVFAGPASYAQYLATLPLALAFPLVATILLWPDARQSRSFVAAWAILALGLFYVLLLAESGPRRMAGNFHWTTQTAAFLLYVEALLLMARKWETRFKPVLLVVLSVHVACGVLFALANAFFPAELWA